MLWVSFLTIQVSDQPVVPSLGLTVLTASGVVALVSWRSAASPGSA